MVYLWKLKFKETWTSAENPGLFSHAFPTFSLCWVWANLTMQECSNQSSCFQYIPGCFEGWNLWRLVWLLTNVWWVWHTFFEKTAAFKLNDILIYADRYEIWNLVHQRWVITYLKKTTKNPSLRLGVLNNAPNTTSLRVIFTSEGSQQISIKNQNQVVIHSSNTIFVWGKPPFFSGKDVVPNLSNSQQRWVRFSWRGLLVESLDFASTDAASGGDWCAQREYSHPVR